VWADTDKTKIGYEIPFTRHFYKYVPPRPLAEIDSEIQSIEAEVQALLKQITD
jgi:type I restriction enzyme M protein